MRSACTFNPLLLVLLLPVLNGCWIPLPEKTAIVVQVLSEADPAGAPVNGVEVIIDGQTLISGAGGTDGQVYKSLGISGDYLLSIDNGSLTDPQGGRRYVLAGSHISGEARDGTMVAYADRRFALADTTMTVPVKEGFITVVTVYVDELLRSPVDNQWLTDGLSTSPYRSANTSEFAATILPAFWWREEPSLAGTVNFTFQLWEDDDGDTRFPLGIADTTNYSSAMNASSPSYIQPDWQVPLAGLQRAEAGSSTNQIKLWSGATMEVGSVIYDLYYSPVADWDTTWENNIVTRDIRPEIALDGGALVFIAGNGANASTNASVLLKNGVEYTFGLKARDASSNLDTLSGSTTRTAVPTASGTLTAASGVSITDTDDGGELEATISCSFGDSLRVYAAPSVDFSVRPFDTRFIRETTICSDSGSGMVFTLDKLINGVSYIVGIEPFDADNNVGSTVSSVAAVPTNSAASDTTQPLWDGGGAITASTTGMGFGQVKVTFDTATDPAPGSTVLRRLYWSSTTYSNNVEAMPFTDISSPVTTSVTFSDLPNNVGFRFVIQAVDTFGNASTVSTTNITLSETDTVGPTWSTNTQALFSSLNWSSGSTVYPVGWTYGYNGFALGQDPASGQGEYVWRVLQNTVESKLGAFYAYSGYYYSSTDTSSHQMSGVSSNVDHRSIFSFMESNLPSTTVMGSPIDSNLTAAFKQRPTAAFASSLEDVTAINPHTLNQIVIEYQTDEDGVAIVRDLTSGGNFLGDLKVLTMNRTSSLSSVPSYLQYKEFFLNYLDTGSPSSDDIADFFPSTQYPVFFSGDLADFDYRDPALQ